MSAARLGLIATCGLGLEEILEAELRALGAHDIERERGAVSFLGTWKDCWRANWRLRTANRVLVEVGTWDAPDGPSLAAGARALVSGRGGRGVHRGGVDAGALLHPDRSFAIQATSTASAIRDTRWAALSLKDLTSGLGKSVFFAFFIAIVGCHNGLTAKGGADGVGRATTNTVVLASVLILVSDFFLTKLFFLLG